MDTFANRLNYILDAKKIKSVELAKALGVYNSAISNYRKGYYDPNDERLQRIADFLEVSPEWLKGKDVAMTGEKQAPFDEFSANINDEEKLLIQSFRKLSPRDRDIIRLICNPTVETDSLTTFKFEIIDTSK